MAAVFLFLGSFFWYGHITVVCVEPEPESGQIIVDGFVVSLSHGCTDLVGFAQTHSIRVPFADRTKIVEVTPSLRDDDSTSITVTPHGVLTHGSTISHKVVQ